MKKIIFFFVDGCRHLYCKDESGNVYVKWTWRETTAWQKMDKEKGEFEYNRKADSFEVHTNDPIMEFPIMTA